MTRVKTFTLLALSALLLLNGCASQRISGALQRYGLDEMRSECVGDRLAETMTSSELQSLSSAARAYKQASQTLKIADFVKVGSEIDAKMPVKIAQAALQCGLVSADVLLLPFMRQDDQEERSNNQPLIDQPVNQPMSAH